MKKETRIKEIQKIIDRSKDDPFGKQEIPWEDDLEMMNVYKIPLNLLIYNKYNGRILSRTKSLESQGTLIDPETDKGKSLIGSLLWDSKPKRNQKTKESLERVGQEKVGIITKDGVIIDGNRRVMLLNHLDKYDYFKAVVLNVSSDENPLEIEKLETTFQMGEDEKLGYNPTEKYLKADVLYRRLSGRPYSVLDDDDDVDDEAIKKISEWMGEAKSTVVEYLEVMESMNDYLDFLDYNGIYTQLDGREDPLIKLTKWVNNFYGERSVKAFDGYRDNDVDDLKSIAYDYIRIKYDGKKFRYIADGLKESHFFGSKEIWESFRDYHVGRIEAVKDAEENIDFNSKNLKSHLDNRDSLFLDSTNNDEGDSFLDENVDKNHQELRYRKAAKQPRKLINDAERALHAIDQGHPAFAGDDVEEELVKLNKITNEMVKKKSAKKVLAYILELLDSVDVTTEVDSSAEMFEQIKNIQRNAYRLEKKVKKL